MTQYRIPKKTSKYYVPAEVYKTTVHFCRQYPLWKAELEIEPDDRKGQDYSGEHVQTSNQSDPTPELAMRRHMIRQKKELVEDLAHDIAGDDDKWLIMGVGYGFTHYQLADKGMLCTRDDYYNMRRKFYYELSKRI